MITYEELVKYLVEKQADYFEINQPLYNKKGNIANAVYDIEIHYGDWKHSWGYLTYLMGELGYVETSHTTLEYDGGDWESGISRFVEKNVCKLFKLNEK